MVKRQTTKKTATTKAPAPKKKATPAKKAPAPKKKSSAPKKATTAKKAAPATQIPAGAVEAVPEKVIKANTKDTKQGVKKGARRENLPKPRPSSKTDKQKTPVNAFEIGNSLWRLSNNQGRQRTFQTSLDLAIACDAYFAWVEANPLKEQRVYIVDKKLVERDVDKMRPMSKTSLAIAIGISAQTFEVTYINSKDPAIKAVAQAAADVIYAQQFEGAAAGLLNPHIISRALGLKDQIENHNIDVVELRRFGNKPEDTNDGGGGDGVDNPPE